MQNSLINAEKEAIKNKDFILDKVKEYFDFNHLKQSRKEFEDDSDFIPGVTSVPYAGRVFDAEEMTNSVSALLDFWLTLGEYGANFENKFAKFLGVKKSILTNSGSSANLLSISALTSHKLGKSRLMKGDEVITVAAGFPTTVAPILQNGLIPVFADNDPYTLNIRVDDLENLISEKTKAVFIAHTLGNPFNLSVIKDFCNKYDLWLVEDNCDSLGSTYNNSFTGTFGDLSTQSFYPPHHLTLGEGGMINIPNKMKLKPLIESFRDWGRDCWCPSGKDNTCNKRYDFNLGDLPRGYDHKFTYSHWGYNIKPLDLQAAIGLAQLEKLNTFISDRKRNWNYLRKGLDSLSNDLYFSLPTHATSWSREDGFTWDDSGNKTDCSWFGFMIGIKEESKINKQHFANYLDTHKINNRMLFGGNLLRQPVTIQQEKDYPGSIRRKKDNNYSGADKIMNSSLFVGTFPGLRKVHLDYIITTINNYIADFS